jgi:hypothetical protein
MFLHSQLLRRRPHTSSWLYALLQKRTQTHGTVAGILLILALGAWTGEGLAETYAILSLVGDHITVIGQGQQTGSHMDQNRRQVVQLPDAALDNFSVQVAGATIRNVRPDSSVIAFRAKDPALYALRDSWRDADITQVAELMALVADQIPPSSDGHLLLITPYLNEIELRTDRDYRGTGKAAGLGLYLDPSTRMRSHTGDQGVGFLGVFANFQLILVNLQSKAIEAQERVVAGTTYAAAQAADRTPWNALSPADKIKALEFLVKRGIERVLPAMLGSKK